MEDNLFQNSPVLTPELKEVENDIRVKAEMPPAILNSPNRIISDVKTDNNFFYKAPIATPQKFTFESTNYNIDDAYAQLNDGTYIAKYDTYKEGANNNEIHAQNQGTGEKWLNGLAKFGGKTLNAVIGGTAGVVYGAGAGIADWKFDSVYDNNFSNWLGDLDTKMNYNLPNYYTQQETQKGLGGQLFTSNFWADKVLGGLSFTAGAIVSEGIWAYATGGTSLATTAARWSTRTAGMARIASGTSKFSRLLKNSITVGEDLARAADNTLAIPGAVNVGRAVRFGQFGEALNTLRFTMTSAGYEASVEALQYKKEQEENFYTNFQQQNGRQPTTEEITAFQENLSSSANAVFGVNMALVGSSNLVTLGKVFNLKSPVKTGFGEMYNRALYGIGKTTPSRLQSINRAVLPFVQNAVTEGLYEEGGQSITSATAGKWLEHAYDTNNTKDSFDLAGALYENISHQYGSKEGWVENGVGIIIGLLGEAGTGNTRGGISREVQEFENRSKLNETYTSKALSEHFLMMNRINGFNKQSEDAQKRGNLTEARIAQDGVIFSLLNNRYQLGDSVSDVTLDVQKALGTVTQEQLAEMGVETDLNTWVQEQSTAFSEVAKAFKKNRQFAEYIIGRNPVAGIQELDSENQLSSLGANNTQEALIQSLAFTMMGGQRSHTTMKEAVQEMAQVLDYEKVKALDTISSLETVTQEKRSQVNIAINRSKSLEEQRQRLVEQLRDIQETTQGDTDTGTKVLRLSDRLAKLTNLISENEASLQQFADEINLNNKTLEQTTGVNLNQGLDIQNISVEDLKNLDNSTKNLRAVMDAIKASNPENSARLEAILEEYNNARKTFGAYQSTVLAFRDGKVNIDNINTLLGRKVLKKNKNLDSATKEWLSEILGNYSEEAVRGLNEISQMSNRDTAISNESIIDKLRRGDNLTEEEQTFYNENKLEIDTFMKREPMLPVVPLPTAKTKLQYLRERLANLISRSNNALTFIGTSTDEFLLEKPTQAEVTEYQTLLKGTLDTNVIDTVNPEQSQRNGVNGLDVSQQLNLEAAKNKTLIEPFKKVVKSITELKSKFNNLINKTHLIGENKVEILPFRKDELVQVGGRFFIKAIINGVPVTFYQSTGLGGKSLQIGRFYPTLGVEANERFNGNWINKIGAVEMASYYGSTDLAQVARFLDNELGNLSEFTDAMETKIENIEGQFPTLEEAFQYRKLLNFEYINSERKTYEGLAKDAQNILNDFNNIIEQITNGKVESFEQQQNISEQEAITETRSAKNSGQRLEELREKLSNWKVLDSFINEENLTMADLAELIQQQQQNISEEETITEITGDDSYAMTQESQAGEKLDDYTLAQNVTGNATIKRNKDGSVTLHHISAESLVNIIGEPFQVTRKDKPIDISQIAIGDIVTTESGLVFSVENGNILKMRSEVFDNIPLLVVRSASTSWTYADLYYFNGSEYVKKPSDFFEDIQADEIYNLEQGSPIRFEIDRQDAYSKQLLDKYKKSPTEENRKALTEGIKIYLVSKGKRISTLKGERGASPDNFKLLREKAFELAIQDSYEVDLQATSTVSAVFLGSPQFFISEEGQLESKPFTETALDKVLTKGYILNGEVITSEELPQVNTSYVSKISRKYPQRKMPIVVVKRGENYIALPIFLNKSPLGQRGLDMVENAIETATSPIEVAKNLNALINQEGVRTEKILPQEVTDENLERIRTAFQEHLIFTTADEIASQDYNKANLLVDAQMYIDADNLEQVINAPKVRIDIQNMLFNQEATFDTSDVKTSVENELDTLAKDLYNDFIRNASTTYINSKGDIIENAYTDAFDEESMLEGDSHLDKLHNIRILREAFKVDFSKNKILRDAIGNEKIERVRILFGILDNINKQVKPKEDILKSGNNNTKCPK